jgi:hypothetical protein
MENKVERLWPQPKSDQDSHAPYPRAAVGEEQQLQELRASLEELELSLTKAEKRVNRLIGERTQLSSLLEKRDKKIEELSRELGKFLSTQLVAGNVPYAKGDFWKRTGDLIAALSSKIKAFGIRGPSSLKESGSNQLAINSEDGGKTPIGARIGDGTDKRVVGVLLFGLEKDEIERLLPAIERDCLATKLRPLLLVDIDAFELFRAHGLPFEFLPSPDQRERFDSSLNWGLYLQRRLSIIRRKWDPVKLVAFGTHATEILSLWSTSPFEDAPLPAMTKSA